MINKEVIGYIFAFSLGAAAGAAVSWKLLKTKYEQIAQEEIDSVKEVYSRRNEKSVEEENESKEETMFSNEDYEEYATIISEKNYNKEGGSVPVL